MQLHTGNGQWYTRSSGSGQSAAARERIVIAAARPNPENPCTLSGQKAKGSVAGTWAARSEWTVEEFSLLRMAGGKLDECME